MISLLALLWLLCSSTNGRSGNRNDCSISDVADPSRSVPDDLVDPPTTDRRTLFVGFGAAQILPAHARAVTLLELPPKQHPSLVRVLLCRHGQTENNRLQIVQGRRLDPPLNDCGKRQAHQLGGILKTEPDLSTIYYSPLLRTRQTAEIAASSLQGTRLESLDELLTIDFGPLPRDQPLSSQTEPSRLYQRWSDGYLDDHWGDGESGRQVLQRIQSALLRLTQTPGSTVAAVTHSSYLIIMMALLLQVDISHAEKAFWMENCSITVVDMDPRPKKAIDMALSTRLIRINERRHVTPC
jgi:broad specificity phosphatase PhoE